MKENVCFNFYSSLNLSIEVYQQNAEDNFASTKEIDLDEAVRQSPVWGDGFRSSLEVCDDGNILSGDGWNSDWSKVEPGFVWAGGSDVSPDVWTSCLQGFYPNDLKNLWITQCGDGITAGNEEWDDGNLSNDDGCSSKWTLETKYYKLEVLVFL